MSVHTTVVFADLFGSTGAFEALGNARATLAVTQVTNWIAKVVESHGGRVVKMLGDGVLTLFDDNPSAINAVVALQRTHQQRMTEIPLANRMPIRIGVAGGDVEMVDGDCYGDAVNIASRLSDLSGPHQIWANSAALKDTDEAEGVRFRMLGPISIRGRAEPCTVYQVEWQEDVTSDFLTVQADLDPLLDGAQTDVLGGQIELAIKPSLWSAIRAFRVPTPALTGAMAASCWWTSVPTVAGCGFPAAVLTCYCGGRNVYCMGTVKLPLVPLSPI